MKAKPSHLVIGFLCGYVLCDIFNALGFSYAKPALAYSNRTIQEVIERCHVYVYDVVDTEGSGDIIC